MTALGRIDQAAGVSAMIAINTAIVQSLFMPFFLATTLISLTLAVMQLFRWNEAGSAAVIAGALIYAIGMFAVTIFVNAPLNDALAAAAPASSEAKSFGDRYLADWTS